jgi:hypothetical protein
MSPVPPPNPPPSVQKTWVRLLIFAGVSLAAIAGVIAFALHRRAQTLAVDAKPTATVVDDRQQLAEVRRQPHLLFRNTALGSGYGRIAVVPLAAAGGARFITPLSADRVYAAGGSGFYLRANRRAFTTYEAVSFDQQFEPRHTFKLAGAPSRTRVSPSGGLAASTVFTAGDSYNTGGFSTRTTIYDLTSGKPVADMEDFAVQKDGQPFKKQDFNFWGVTFAEDNDRFYATLASGNMPYLIEGSISKRSGRVLREAVECPSLSPDGTRVAFKSRLTENGRRIWRLHVYDLKTKHETVVSESHNVDDQAEWLDADHVLYALPRAAGGSGRSDIWVARADGTGVPELFVSDGTSPCVVRP